MKKKLVGLLELEMADLECFLEKTPLNPLGVKLLIIKSRQNTETVQWHKSSYCL
jgi:hypothetical protein